LKIIVEYPDCRDHSNLNHGEDKLITDYFLNNGSHLSIMKRFAIKIAKIPVFARESGFFSEKMS